MRRVSSRLLLLALAAAPAVALAGPFDDTLVQPPSLGTPQRASLVGALAQLVIGPGDVSRGTFSLPAPIALPSERGALLARVLPTYSPDAGASEWGVGWANALEIRRFRALGEVDYVDDDFSSPWGQLVRGEDGHYYPRGLSQIVRASLDPSGAGTWTVVDAGGTRHVFRASDAVTTSRGTYAWVLGEVSTVEGERTELDWVKNTSGRPFLSRVRWGGRGPVRQYELELVYESLATELDDYRAGVRQSLDRRVVGLRQRVRRADTGSMALRFTWDLRYTPSPSGPAFYLTEIQKTYATSGAVDPVQRYRYDLDGMFGEGTFLSLPELDPFLAAWGTSALAAEEVSLVDLDEDGVVELEHAASMLTWQLGADGSWGAAELPPMTGAEEPLCRRAPGPGNVPRRLLPLAAGDAPLRVVVAREAGGQTTFLTCDPDGRLLGEAAIAGSWELDEVTRLADLDRDLRPELVRLNLGSVDVWQSTGTRDSLRLEAMPRQSLSPRFAAEAAWIQDMNGDGVVDLVARAPNVIVVWAGKGAMTFEPVGRRFHVRGLDGRRITSLDPYDITWLDANRDGLLDMLTTYGGTVRLYTNDGRELVARDLPALRNLGFDSGLPLAVDLSARGESEIVLVREQHAQALAFTQPSNGLLVEADDGMGTTVQFGWRRSDPAPGLADRPALLETITQTSVGEMPVTYQYDYGEPARHSRGRFLLGFGRTRRVTPLTSEDVELHHDDDIQGAILAETVVDSHTTGVYRFVERGYAESSYHGVRWWRPTGDRSGWRRLDGTGEVSSRNDILAYERGVCPTTTQNTSRAGTLRKEMVLADVTGLVDAPHCLASDQRIIGRHADPTRDFDYRARIDRDAFGAVTAVRSTGAGSPLLLQQVEYDSEHRVVAITRPGQGTTRATWEPGTGRLLREEAADGVASSAVAMDPVTDALLDVKQERGEAAWTTSYRFDAEERLWRTWDDLASGVTEELGYRPAGNGLPAATTVRTRRAPGVVREAVTFESATGRTLAELVRHPAGWSAGQLTAHDASHGVDVAYDRGPFGPGFDPMTLSVSALFAGAQELGRSQRTGFGDVVASENTVQAGVVRRLTGERQIIGSELVLTQRENGGLATRTGVDDTGRLWWRTDEAGEVTGFDRDALGRLVGVTLPDGKRHTLRFDGHGRHAEITRDGVGRVTYSYDPVTGLLAARTLFDTAGHVERIVRTTRDAIGRPILERHEHPRSQTSRDIRFEWDGVAGSVGQRGLLSRITGPGFEKLVTHRADGRISVTSTHVLGFRRLEESFGFLDDDSEAWRRYRLFDASGQELQSVLVENVYDAGGRLAALHVDGLEVAGLEYDGRGHLARVRLAGGGVRTWRRDAVTHRVNGFAQSTPSWSGGIDWRLDARGLLAAETIAFGDARIERQFGHEARRYLTTATGDAGTATYAYDEAGLLVSEAETGTLFDASGRVIRRDALELVYGASGQVEQARRGDRAWTYLYDEAGQRLARADAGASAPREAWMGGGHIDASGLTLPLTVDGQVLGLLEAGTFVPVLADARGTLLSEGAALVVPTPYGVRATRPARAAALDYAAQGYDADLGTVRMGARDFDPTLGRFLTPDPMMLEDLESCAGAGVECNLYSYGRNDPLLYWDPQGHATALNPNGGPSVLLANQYELVGRSFAPFCRFGGPGMGIMAFEGDYRRFSTSFADSARVTQSVTINPSMGTIVGTRAWSDETQGFGLATRLASLLKGMNPFAWNLTATSIPTSTSARGGLDAMGRMHLQTSYGGAMPLFPAPDIDVKTNLTVTRVGNRMIVAGEMRGDTFPNAELFIRDAAGNSVFLHGYATDGNRVLGPYIRLPGDAERPMGKFEVNIALDDDGNFKGVEQGGTIVPIESHNYDWAIRGWPE